jgi:hypothetical protein
MGSGCIDPPFWTLAQDGDEWLASRLGRFIPGEDSAVPIVQDVGWVPEPIWTLWRGEKSFGVVI